MLSLLLTAVLLFGALVAALELRSWWRVAAVFALAVAGFVGLGRRTLDGLATPRLHLVYEIDDQHPVLPGPDLAARTGDAVRSRLRGIGARGGEVRASGNTLDLVAPASEADAVRIRNALGVVGLLEFVEVDDDKDVFLERARGKDDNDDDRPVRFQQENVPIGPGKSTARYYAFLPAAENEDRLATLARAKKWSSTVRIPEDRRIAFEVVDRYDEDLDTFQYDGWRTFVLHKEPLLTSRHLEDAWARPESNYGMGGWLVNLRFTSEGGSLFEEATGRLVKRRFAIVLDGVVESAPIVQSRITGRNAVITMGHGTPEEQARDAKQLEAVLRSGALPAPLLLTNENVIEAPLGAGVVSALTSLAGLLLMAVIGLGGVLVFRVKGAPRATA